SVYELLKIPLPPPDGGVTTAFDRAPEQTCDEDNTMVRVGCVELFGKECGSGISPFKLCIEAGRVFTESAVTIRSLPPPFYFLSSLFFDRNACTV
ncbi:MAG TPA: hypothetical protein VGA87_04655, partial [Pyrinomonadaceae bacterium]